MPRNRLNRVISREQRRNVQKKRRLRLFIMMMLMQLEMVHREIWIHPLNAERVEKGEFYRLYLDQRHFPDKFFENYLRSTHQFDDILSKIAPLIRKKDTNFRKAITPEEKLVLTLR